MSPPNENEGQSGNDLTACIIAQGGSMPEVHHCPLCKSERMSLYAVVFACGTRIHAVDGTSEGRACVQSQRDAMKAEVKRLRADLSLSFSVERTLCHVVAACGKAAGATEDCEPPEIVEAINALRAQLESVTRERDEVQTDRDNLRHNTRHMQKQRNESRARCAELEAFARNIRENGDCDSGADGAHPSYCRSCEAKKLLALPSEQKEGV